MDQNCEQHEFSPHTLDSFMTRFGRSTDGWLNKLEIDASSGPAVFTAEFKLYDLLNTDMSSVEFYSKLTVKLFGVTHFYYDGGPDSVINTREICAVNLRYFPYLGSERLFLDFAPAHTDEESSVDSVAQLTLDHFFDSHAYCLAQGGNWNVEPYLEIRSPAPAIDRHDL